MGKTQSTVQMPNNPFETEQYKRQQYELQYRQTEKDEERKRKREEKRRRRQVRMAKLKSPKAPHVPSTKKPSSTKLVNKNDGEIIRDYDMEAKRRMQDQLALDTETFLLNQLMLSVQLFGHYEKEIWDAIERNRRQENEKTSQIEKYCKIVILPDGLYEALHKRIKYKARFGPNKDVKTYLQIPTQYIVHENIEITNPGEPSVYSTITDAPIYKMEIDQIKPEETHIGYVRLKSTEKIQNLNFHHNDEDINKIENETERKVIDDDEEVPIKLNSKHRDSVLILTKQKKPHKKGSLSAYQTDGSLSTTSNSTSSHSPSNSDYDYAYITALNTRQPLSSIKTTAEDGPQEPFSATKLPAMCISNVPVPSISNDDYDSAGEDDEIEPTYEIKQYLNSKTFLTYFANLFRDSLANDIEISPEELSNATWKGPIIYSSCWETIPAISCPWPNEAYEWIHRQRDIKENPITQQKFQWPTRVMVNKVVSLGCHVVPLGYVPKYGINPYRELEWKIVFPEAERYLESSLTNTQAKVYIIARLLIQTYVEPYIDNTQNMFTAEHLRAHLFWQCEMNYAAWPEEYLGEALIRFLNSLLETIKRQRLPDYFLPKRNLFENIPERIMVELHKRIFRITENPVMHLMNALRNLTYSSSFAMAQLNYKKLYSAIVIDNPLKIINPMFRIDDNVDTNKSDNEDGDDSDGMVSDVETNGDNALGVIGYYQKADRTDKSRRRRTKRVQFLEAEKLSQKMEKEKKLEMEKEKQREAESMFDVRFSISKHLEKIRRVIIYELFIDHFIALSTSASTFKSYNQALIYLKQAYRLCSLLSDDGHPDKADNLLDKIEELQTKILIERNRESTTRPQLPRRESFLEPSNRGKFRVKLPTQKNDKDDPYKNTREKRMDAAVVSPQEFEENNKKTSDSGGNRRYSKSQLATSPLAIHRLRRASQKVNAQIHSPPIKVTSQRSGGLNENKENFVHDNRVMTSTSRFDDEFEIYHPSPRTPETPIKTVKFFDNDSLASSNFNGYSSGLNQNSQSHGYRANRSISDDGGGDVTTVL